MDKVVKTILKPVFDLVAKPGLHNPHSPCEAQLMAAGVKPVAILNPEDVTIDMKAAIRDGRIVHIGDHNAVDAKGRPFTAQVFAQADKAADGQELFARCYHNGEGCEALPEDQFGDRIGQLLGYTENDIAWFKAIQSAHPVVKWLMDETSDIRSAARKESMLMKAKL